MTPHSRRAGTLSRFFFHWFRRETVRRAVTVAAVVGPILTTINQYEALISFDFSPRVILKIVLTFVVPYCVASFSSARAYMEHEALVQPSSSCRLPIS